MSIYILYIWSTDASRPTFNAIYQGLMVTMYVVNEGNKCYLLGCDLMQSGRSLLIFQRNIRLPLYCLFGLLFDDEDWATTFLRNVDKIRFYQTTLHHTPERSNYYDRNEKFRSFFFAKYYYDDWIKEGEMARYVECRRYDKCIQNFIWKIRRRGISWEN
jgi:hypothetical protein